MAAKHSVVRTIDWRLVPLQGAALAACISVVHAILRPDSIDRSLAVGAAIYLAYSFGSRRIITAAHQRGLQLTRTGRYAEALPLHEKSYRFFTAHPWIDTLRGIVLMSPSAASYRELALLTMAFCHVQLGNAAKAKECYQTALMLFPDSTMAKSALTMIGTLESADRPSRGDAPRDTGMSEG